MLSKAPVKKLLAEKTNNTRVNCSSIEGVGVGLRSQHYAEIMEARPSIPWFEVLIDNYIGSKPYALHQLLKIRQHYPVTFHGVGLSLGSADPLDKAYLQNLKNIIHQVEPVWFSEHLSWSHIVDHWVPDLLPLPYTKDVIEHLVDRIHFVQDFLQQQILIENVSTYISLPESEMPEWIFLNEIVHRSGCSILLDVNNLYVNSINHAFQARDYFTHLTPATIKEIHLAGYSLKGNLLFDTHGETVHPPVWQLYREVLEHIGMPIPTLIEWDQDIPSFSRLCEEANLARRYMMEVSHDKFFS